MSWQICIFLCVLIIGVTFILKAYFFCHGISYYETIINRKFRELKEELEELNNDNANTSDLFKTENE